MSTSSPQQEAAIDQAKYQSMLSADLNAMADPQLRFASSLFGKELAGGPDELPPMVQEAFGKARMNMQNTYSQLGTGNEELIKYRALTAGAPVGEGFTNAATGKMQKTLADDLSVSLANLKFQEGQAGLQTYNSLLQGLGQVSQTSFGLAQGFGGAANSAISGLSNTSQMQGALGGAITGAGLGAQTGNPYAIAGGAVVGGVLGALGSG